MFNIRRLLGVHYEPVLTACDVRVVAFLRRHPEVRRAGVEHHLEALRRRSDRDDAKVLSLHRNRIRIGLVAAPETRPARSPLTSR